MFVLGDASSYEDGFKIARIIIQFFMWNLLLTIPTLVSTSFDKYLVFSVYIISYWNDYDNLASKISKYKFPFNLR